MSGAPERRVLLIGATRATGLLAARALQRRGIQFRILARHPAAAMKSIGAGVDIVGGDLTQRKSLSPAFAGVTDVLFTAGVRSGRFARQSVVRATEYEGVLHTIDAALSHALSGRFVYMTSIGVRRPSSFATALNLWKGNTLLWRRRAEEAIRSSGLDYTIVRAAFLLNRPAGQHAIAVGQTESPLTFFDCVARADVANALVESLSHPDTGRTTFEIKWSRGPRVNDWFELLAGLRPDG